MEYQEDRGFRLLKFIVKFMGIVLVAGVFFLFYVVVKRIEDPNFMRLNPRCGIESIKTLTVDGVLESISEVDKHILLLVRQPDGSQYIQTIDGCSGEVTHVVDVVQP